MLERTINSILAEPKLIPAYLFMALMLGILGWEFIKFIIFIIKFRGKNKK